MATLGAVFLSAFFAAVAGAVFTAAFLVAVFLVAACSSFAASARFNAHRFWVAATIAALPALLSFRFGFDSSGIGGAGDLADFFDAAHLLRCASAIRARPAALMSCFGFAS